MTELAKNYDPQAIETKWYNHWLEKGYFHNNAGNGGQPYCIVIPPPNVTGILHMGHALNDSIQDVLVRWQRMQGRNTVWVPGTDHAGIATQNVVERQLKKENITRQQLGREKFLEKVWAWKQDYGSTIINQLKKLGCSCDWSRERFTMDEGLSQAVAEVFTRLYNEGLIHRGHYIINWCPRCQTALSDEESIHQDLNGKLYYIRYPLKDGKRKEGLVVATTRPETMFGDTAVGINPRDQRYQEYLGKTLLLPIINREIKIVEDDYVDPSFGTGAFKVTPAHDPNDFEMGKRHNLEQIDVMNDDGTMNANAGPFAGLDRFECRRRVVELLEKEGLLEKVEDRQHSVSHCYRCNTVIEPRLSRQWFVKMKTLARPAIEAVKDGRIRFVPERWNKVYLEWMENIRDWCISRQIWWGHQIPVYTCGDCSHEWAAATKPTACPKCESGKITQDPDVLDTWFSSWLWPFSVFGWPKETPDLKFYYPTNSLVTGSEIIFFWVARMIMAGIHFMGDIPFSEVYIHGTVRDDIGRKMSKSLGNSIDPLKVIEQYSADALRFSLLMLTATGQDVFLSDDKFDIGRNFGTKIWNAARFMQLHMGKDATNETTSHTPELDRDSLTPDDRHILAKLNETILACTRNLEMYRFNDAAKVLYDFFWHQYCDWYIEYAKMHLYGEDPAQKAQVLKIMNYVFPTALRLLHPFMPFLTEELWNSIGYNLLHPSIMTAPWPKPISDEQLDAWRVSNNIALYVDAKHDLIRVARTLMADYSLQSKGQIGFIVRANDTKQAELLRRDCGSVVTLLRAQSVKIEEDYTPSKATPSAISQLGTVYMPIEGLIDLAAETKRLSDQLEKTGADLQKVSKKLENIEFISKAPQEVVAVQEERKRELLEKMEKLKALLSSLQQAQ